MKWYKTKNGKISQMYTRMFRSSRKRKHPVPTFSRQEFREWLEKNDFDMLYAAWVESGFKKDLAPSVDRLDNNYGYYFKNIQLVTWEENNKNGNIAIRQGKLKNGHKPVYQFDKNYNFIAEYVSINEAGIQTGIAHHTISLACRGKRKTAGGYIWRFKKGAKNG